MKKEKLFIAIVGATGVVGREMLSVLEASSLDIEGVRLLASERSMGEAFTFKGKEVLVDLLRDSSFEGVDVALFSAGGSISKDYVPIAVRSGAIVIDNTSYFRMMDDVPLVLPEVNSSALHQHKGIIANPNCSTAQLLLPLYVLHKLSPIERIVVSTYQSVSGAGKDAVEELERTSRSSLKGEDTKVSVFSSPIAFNLIPHIDEFLDNGYTKEEMKVVNETRKILNAPAIQITVTAVRVPVFIGHSEAVNVVTKDPVEVETFLEALSDFQGITVVSDSKSYHTPREISGKNDVFVSRVRKDLSHERGIDMWVVADNLRKGAALNAVQIVEALVSI